MVTLILCATLFFFLAICNLLFELGTQRLNLISIGFWHLLGLCNLCKRLKHQNIEPTCKGFENEVLNECKRGNKQYCALFLFAPKLDLTNKRNNICLENRKLTKNP